MTRTHRKVLVGLVVAYLAALAVGPGSQLFGRWEARYSDVAATDFLASSVLEPLAAAGLPARVVDQHAVAERCIDGLPDTWSLHATIEVDDATVADVTRPLDASLDHGGEYDVVQPDAANDGHVEVERRGEPRWAGTITEAGTMTALGLHVTGIHGSRGGYPHDDWPILAEACP